jgi:two-component system sensor kinase FixL
LTLKFHGPPCGLRSEAAKLTADAMVMRETSEILSAPASALRLAQVFVRDRDGIVRFWSDGLSRLYGFSEDEAMGRKAHALLQTEFLQPESDIVSEFTANGAWSGELVQRRKDGRSIVVVSQWTLMRAGETSLVTETCNDISAHRQRADYLAAIVHSTDDAIIGKTLDGLITSWNRAAEIMLGYNAAEIIGQPIQKLLPRDRIREEDIIIREIRRGNSITHYDTLRLKNGGTEIPISLTVSPIRAADGNIIGASSIMRDISERRSAEERFHRMQSELAHMGRLSEMGQMASALAHELNQPLTATGNYVAAARRSLEGPAASQDKAVQNLLKAGQQVVRAGEIIRRLRGFLSKAEPETHSTAIERLIEDTGALAQIDAKFRDIQLRFDFNARQSLAVVDRVQFQQVLFNLLRNAFEATTGRKLRSVIVSTTLKNKEIEVGVADSGSGIAPEIAENLFRPFMTTKESGMGVGLSICRTIVEGMGGRIWHQPSPLGGAMFVFTVPLAEE